MQFRSSLPTVSTNPLFMDIWRLFWAKTNREKIDGLPADWTHPLWAHLIDVGSAAQILWDNFLPLSLRQKMADGIGMSLADAGQFLSIWIGLHDLGKGIPNFQGMHEPSKERLEKAGLHFHERPNRLHHGHASIAICYRWLREKKLPFDTLLDAAAACVGIHHGKLCQSECWESVAEDKNTNAVLGNNEWKQAQLHLAEAVFTAWGAIWPDLGQFKEIGTTKFPWPDWLMAFAGWATLADWLGSMQKCYDTSVQATDDLAAYVPKSRDGAEKAYETAGLNQQAALRNLPFEQHFGFEPRPLQQIARDLPLQTETPNLVIVEGPTGEGKTESAFYLTARLGGGVYVAMPSQATSDGLFPRLKNFIKGDPEKNVRAAHAGETAALRLVHGNDLLHDDALSLLAVEKSTAFVDDPSASDTNVTDPQAKSRVLSWFMPKKRALLVPYGVGTVDQLFLGVLYARHFFLRLFALTGKTVVFDEVHAYDTYMNTLFCHLLSWLRALDVNIVVLSATLPGKTRADMLKAWGTPDPTPAGAVAPYPVAWHAAGGHVKEHPFPPTEGRGQVLTFRWCTDDIGMIAEQTRKLLQKGATVIVICNKVKRAQDVFKLLADQLPVEDRILLHSQMPQAWRKQREKDALARFGKDRPARPGLLVGTQVIEQSLDLDADAMITDLAPVDLLLQRAGRLHRHDRKNRPAGFDQPILYIACADAPVDALPDVKEVSGSGYIYGEALLWKTRAVLQRCGGWVLPLGNDRLPGYRTLVEAVYGDLPTPPDVLSTDAQTVYQKAIDQWIKDDRSQQAEAAKRLVPPPRKLNALFNFQKADLVEEEDAAGSSIPQHLLAATRNPDGINAEVLLLHPTEKGWATKHNGSTILYHNGWDYLSPEAVRALFGASIRIGNPAVVSALWQQENADWKAIQEKHRLLQRFQLIELTDNAATIGTHHLRLDERLGLIISKQ